MKKALCIGALVCMAGAFWYGRQAKPESQYRPPVVEKAPQSDFVMNMNSEAVYYFKKGMDRMKAAGVEYTEDQAVVMMKCADRDYSAKDKEHRLDAEEAKELYEVVLSPDSALGRLARQHDKGARPLMKVPAHYEPLLRTLIDYDRNGVVSADEVRRAHAWLGE